LAHLSEAIDSAFLAADQRIYGAGDANELKPSAPYADNQAMPHPDFETLGTSWELSLRADGYASNSVRAYRQAVASLAAWLDSTSPGARIGPADLGRDHVRGWLAHLRETGAASTAQTRFAGVRHFYRWLVTEEEAAADPTQGIRVPKPGQPATPVLSADELRRLLDACAGPGFTNRRDRAIMLMLLDTGVRISELAGLEVADVDLRDRMAFVVGKGSLRSGPRRRAVPLGVKAAQAVDRYLRERRRHPHATSPALWLGAGGRAVLSADGVDMMLKRRAKQAGLEHLHAHVFRHTFAHNFRAAGGSEGDLMVLGGWHNRTMLDRYGASAAADRAAEAARRLSLGDRL
jgi:site-specific recombinase XerD